MWRIERKCVRQGWNLSPIIINVHTGKAIEEIKYADDAMKNGKEKLVRMLILPFYHKIR